MANVPLVSVLLPVYNGEPYLREAVESILNQTFRDFEFIIINDGSTDRTEDIIAHYQELDNRIRVYHQVNQGLIATLNKGLGLARGKYIARMDADDVSRPLRLERQVACMEERPTVCVCGTWVRTIGGKHTHVWRYATDSRMIKAQLFLDSCLAHPSVILRRSVLAKYNVKYNPNDLVAEDWGLWNRMSFFCDLANIPEVLLLYRLDNPHKESIVKKGYLKRTVRRIHEENLRRLDIVFKASEMEVFEKFASWDFADGLDFANSVKHIAWMLIEANKKAALYPEPEFSRVVSRRYFAAMNRMSWRGLRVFNEFRNSELVKYRGISRTGILKFFLKCVFHYKSAGLS